MNKKIKTKVMVLGGGPSGYSAAFRCADLGLETVLVERYSTLGGVCLNVGCIPSKALLYVTKLVAETRKLSQEGILVGTLETNVESMKSWKTRVIDRLKHALRGMAQARKVQVIQGYGRFTSDRTIQVEGEQDPIQITFDNAIIAAGSRPIKLPDSPHDYRIWDSTDALALPSVPKRMAIVGGGIIGMEMATIYNALGSKIDVIEMGDHLIPGADIDVAKVFTNSIRSNFNIRLETKVTKMNTNPEGIYLSTIGIGKKSTSEETQCYDVVLIAIGREPNGKLLDAEMAGIEVDHKGFIHVDKQMRTNVPHIYAIGDIIGQPMLAHKGTREGHVAAEVIAHKHHYFDHKVIPSIVYTEPEVAWVGMTEREAKEQRIRYEVSIFPWSASGRAMTSNCQEGITKLIFDEKSHRVIGGAVVGVNGGELLGEIGLAIEMGCDAQDIALTMHAHPTLYESVGLAAEMYEGSITDMLNVK